MDKFLDAYDLSILNHEVLNNLNRSIISNEIKAVTHSLQTKTSPEPDGFTAEFYQTFKELALMLLKLFHKIEVEGMFTNTFYQESVTLTPKQDKHMKKMYGPFSLKNIDAKTEIKYLQSEFNNTPKSIWFHSRDTMM
jgi:hypothetical protein